MLAPIECLNQSVESGLIIAGQCWVFWLSMKPPLMPLPLPSDEEKGSLKMVGWKGEVYVLCMSSTDPAGWRGGPCYHLRWEGDENPGSLLAFLDTTLVGVLGCLLQRHECGSLGLSLSLCLHEWRWGHSFLYGIWLELTSYCLKAFCLARLPLSWSLS